MLSFYKVGGPIQLHVHSLRRCFKRNLCSPCASKHNSGEKIKKDLLFQKKKQKESRRKKHCNCNKYLKHRRYNIEADWQLESCNRCLAENVNDGYFHVFTCVTGDEPIPYLLSQYQFFRNKKDFYMLSNSTTRFAFPYYSPSLYPSSF